MRVILVGSGAARAKLRAQVNGSASIVAEFSDLAAARAAHVDADAFLLAPDDSPDPMGHATPVERLTAREVEVLELLAEGLSNKAIGHRLGISDQTVKFHVGSISGKLGARNRTEAVRLAVRGGLISF